MSGRGIEAYQIRINQLVFGGLFLMFVLASARGLISGGTGKLNMFIAGTILAIAVIALDKYYWVLFPAFWFSKFKPPGLPFSGLEMGCLLLISIYCLRLALRKEQRFEFNPQATLAIPLFAWICMIWISNPTGLEILRSSSIGARFYIRIVIGFAALLVLSSMRFNEKDCKIIFFVILFSLVYAFLAPQFKLGRYIEEIYTETGGRGSRYELLGSTALYVLMLARYPLPEIVRSTWRLTVVGSFAIIAIYTGKRRAAGSMILFPLVRCFLTNRDKLFFTVLTAIALVVVSIAAAGDDLFWKLPQSARRSLSIVIDKYATTGAMGRRDLFREGVREYGREVIRKDPWFGRRGFAMDRAETAWIVFSRTTNLFGGHAFSGNWHSTWYAFACDFGLPALAFWTIFIIPALIHVFRNARRLKFSEYANVVYLFFSMNFFVEFIFSYTSGHSSLSALNNWVHYGMLLALIKGQSSTGSESSVSKYEQQDET